MARPEKQGIPYFSFDVDFFSDIKVKKIMRACGPKSIPVLINLLCNIYRDKGYYIEWDDEIGFLVADEVGTNESIAEEVVNKSLQVGFFDKGIFEKYKILTSKGIQKRYQKATYQRKNNAINSNLLILEHEKQGYSHEKHMNNSVNHIESTQSKEKQSKVNKSKVNNTDVLFEHFLQIFSDFTKGIKSQPRSRASASFVDLGTEERRQQAIIGAKNYVEWYKSTGERIKYSINAAKFLEDMVFMDYQEMPEVKEKRDTYRKAGKSIPEWSTTYQEPEYSEEEIADVFKD
jgi:hypothetical protein